ncbi:MAG: LegC family aminotransferase [Spirochaetales bacterium]|nr:LegC family aminotransferase [Spirochaetales bacterium]
MNTSSLISYIKNTLYPNDLSIPLHRPVFEGREKEYLADCIDSNFVSSVGQKVIDFENQIREYTGAKFAAAVVNGTAALHAALIISGVTPDTEVITQPLSFAATCNAIAYCGAKPVFIDVNASTLGLSAEKLEKFLKNKTQYKNGKTVNRKTRREITACVPMHTFGHPCEIEDIARLCREYNISLVEDAAESLGSIYKEKHTGTFGNIGIISFNGNKILTTGGGGMILTNDSAAAERAKFLTTTGKRPHPYEFFHPEVAFNYRMPNLNAALGCAQMEQLPAFVEKKRALAEKYKAFCAEQKIHFIHEPAGSKSNYWLNAILLSGREERDQFLKETNSQGVMTRPVWDLMNTLPAFSDCQVENISTAENMADRLVNLPSSVPTES